ncbi:Multiple RNA-binding domain-containing protein 1 [Termitomyces sp. J132]|nr:Multiple RNA-binding domain-containing protein 1 [Termitomyces sp. J132]
MSRLIIKNLPTYITPARLREHFEQKGHGAPGGTLTDFKVARRQDGTARRFGFVGYKTEEEARKAKEWFDRSFIDSARISVSVVEGAKDAPMPRPNKRRKIEDPSVDGSAEKSKVKLTKPNNEKPKTDDQLEEFMKVMQPRNKKGPSWANDAPSEGPVVPAPEVEVDVPMAEDKVAHDETISDLEWMKRRMGSTVDEVDKVFEQSDDEDEPSKAMKPEEQAEEPEQPKDPTIETILETSRLFVRNLAFSCTDADLAELFSPFGDLTQVHIPIDINTKQPKGVAYVTFKSPSCAVAAYEALDRKSFQGRLIHILAAVDRKGKFQVEEGEGRKRTVKGEKQAKRKAMAGKEFNWSMLYMNADAVASSIADRLNIDKASILNPEDGDNAAVKLALAETHIINETKAYLDSQGVDLTSFSSRVRSDTVILVKNIPYGTSTDQIRELFAPHGELKRVLVPPAGTMAVVEFDKADEAMKGFRAVAYRRLGNSVIYLEKGPQAMFVEGAVPGPSTYALPEDSALRGKRIAEQELGDVEDAEAVEPSITGGATLYVKNLAFSTTQERLAKTFRHLPSFAFARVQTKPDPKRSGERLSMGYGFIGFKDAESAKKALGSLQGFVLDGHQLHVKFAGRGVESEEKKGLKSGSKTTKMIVKNVPFEATKKDIQALFGAHGHLKSVRLPKKFDSRTRGFAFLDFVSRAEAENAYATLRHTHLLGRHLVLEWAEEGEQDIDALRKKAGIGYGDGKFMPGRKRKIDMGKDEEDVEDLEV